MHKRFYLVTTIGGCGVSDDTVKNYTIPAHSRDEALRLGRKAFLEEYHRPPRIAWVERTRTEELLDEED